MQTAGIYIHIPFCRKKCIYCDFYSVPNANARIQPFVNAICSEIRQCKIDTSDWIFDTCFVGGGTPSLINAKQLEQILIALENRFNIRRFSEFTMEVNPGEISENKLRDFRSLGVNRLSVGIQSLNPDELHFLSRIHSPKDATQTVHSARKAGFENISCDLIYGIPGQTSESWQYGLRSVIDLNPEHISAYILTVEKNTPLYNLEKNKMIHLPSDSDVLEKFHLTNHTLSDAGYHRYEISNYAKPGKSCKHNLHYWKIEPYVGFGPSAHSFDGANRWANISDLSNYIQNIAENETIKSLQEQLTKVQQTNEMIGFGLRLAEGFETDLIPKSLSEQFQSSMKKADAKWLECLNISDERISLTEKGMTFADAIAVELILD